jgi:hypothetical protein
MIIGKVIVILAIVGVIAALRGHDVWTVMSVAGFSMAVAALVLTYLKVLPSEWYRRPLAARRGLGPSQIAPSNSFPHVRPPLRLGLSRY